MNKTTFGKNDGTSIELATVIVFINGESKDIIPAFTKFSIKRKDLSKSKILENLDKGKILPAIFAFTSTKPFRDENITLFDYNGVEIPQELDNDVLVSLDKPDTINLLGLLDAPLISAMVECKSVAEAYSYVATSFAIAQLPTKDEWIGLGAVTTKENVLSQILQFAEDNKMNGTTAPAYFGLSCRIVSLKKAAMMMESPLEGAKFRSVDEAIKLFQAIERAFGARCAVLTQYVKALNVSIERYSFDEVVEVLNDLDKEAKQFISDAQNNERSLRIQAILSEKIVLCRNRKAA